jgi:hypothetical protein
MDLLDRVHWGEYVHLLSQGHPPIVVQLVIVNAIFLILWIVQRARGTTAFRQESGIALQLLMLASNTYILLYGDVVFP